MTIETHEVKVELRCSVLCSEITQRTSADAAEMRVGVGVCEGREEEICRMQVRAGLSVMSFVSLL